MNIGIIGSGRDKFQPETEERARSFIRQLLADPDTVLVSGHSPVGGVDFFAEEEADKLGRQKIIHAPEVEQWNPPGQYGFKARNLDIARDSDIVHIIVVKEYPPGYVGLRFDLCYHCAQIGRDAKGHKKSGGCWTGKQALKLGKEVIWHVIG